jgi:hypothetical protein
LALILDRHGEYAQAEEMHRQTLVLSREGVWIEDLDMLTCMSNLALVLSRQGKYAEAKAMNRQTLGRQEKVLGADHPETLASVYCLAHLLANQHCQCG